MTTSTENNKPDSERFKSEKSVDLYNDTKILDFVDDIEFPDDIKPNIFVKEEVLKAECSGIDQKPNMVDPIIPNDRKMMDFVHGIEFSDDIKPKLEIKEETLDMKTEISEKPKKSRSRKRGRTPDQIKQRTDEEKIEFKKRYACDVCHVNNSSEKSLKMHLAGKKHFRIQQGLVNSSSPFLRRKQLKKKSCVFMITT